MMPSFISRNMSRSSRGRPMSRRNTVHGRGTAKSSWKSHVPLAGEVVHDLVDELDHLAVERRHVLRREQRVEDPAVLHVLRADRR